YRWICTYIGVYAHRYSEPMPSPAPILKADRQQDGRCDMSNCIRRIVLGAALLAGIAMAANAQTVTAAGENPGRQIAPLPPPEAAAPANNIALPEVTVLAPRTYPQPYANGGGPRVSSYSIPRSEHYQASPDYATDPALHPYSSGLGPRASSQGTVRAE